MTKSRSTTWLKGSLLLGASLSMMAVSTAASAQDAEADEVIAVGIRQSLENALGEKREADSLVEVILAEDIGKLPDQNLAEVLENVTGIQITRTAGVGTGVQIRGTNANRIEVNGVSTVGSGAGRSGIDFEDVNASIIAGVEVIKAPEASTIEGSVGGTINLRTIRPLDLKKTLLNVRVQGEQSSLTTEGITPRISAAVGKKWVDPTGPELGIVLSGSYTEQESVSFRPRADRDNIASPPGANPAEFLGIQFLVQEQENFDYETINFAGSLEIKPNDRLKLYLDAIFNDQERSQDSYRLQASGVSSFRQSSIPTEFETIDFGVGPGQFPAALAGNIERRTAADDNPNLRMSSDTGARVTNSSILSFGTEWDITDKLSSKFEFATTRAETSNPNLSTTLNFINPNGGLVARVNTDDGLGNDDSTGRRNVALEGVSLRSTQAELDAALAAAVSGVTNGVSGFVYNDNSTPFAYDLSNNSLAFGVNFASSYAPTEQQLLDAGNYVLDQVIVGDNSTRNAEDAFRADFNYDLEGSALGDLLTSVDVGYRYNKSSSKFNRIEDRIGGFTRLQDSPNASLFEDFLVEGPDNYDDADGRDLFIQNFLLVDPDAAFSDRQNVIDALQNAVITNDPGSPDILNLRDDQNAFYDIREKTNAFYAQANFEQGVFSGNVGVRYVDTEIESIGFGFADANGDRSLESTIGEYDFWLPRANLAIEPREDVLVRASYGTDIRRPNFNSLGGFTFGTQENSVVRLGNPSLSPEKVDSFDISADWYFAPAAVLSIGYFNKKRTDIFRNQTEGAALLVDPNDDTQFVRETNPNCPGGGIFNPNVVPNVLGDPQRLGLCVDRATTVNDPGSTTQQGIEFAFQYDLSNWEDQMGGFAWASGFGVLANYTYQDFSGDSIVDTTSGRGANVLGDVSIEQGLLDFSKNAYNITAFYEKYGLSARARYTWREGFRTNDFGGGANTSGSSTFSFPVNTLDRGQLNASINYDVNENFTVGVEGVNLTKSNIFQRCVADTGPLCFAGYPDRRIVFGGSYTF